MPLGAEVHSVSLCRVQWLSGSKRRSSHMTEFVITSGWVLFSSKEFPKLQCRCLYEWAFQNVYLIITSTYSPSILHTSSQLPTPPCEVLWQRSADGKRQSKEQHPKIQRQYGSHLLPRTLWHRVSIGGETPLFLYWGKLASSKCFLSKLCLPYHTWLGYGYHPLTIRSTRDIIIIISCFHWCPSVLYQIEDWRGIL